MEYENKQKLSARLTEYKGFLWEFTHAIFGPKDAFSNITPGWSEWKYSASICKYRTTLRILLRLFISRRNAKTFANKEHN